MTLDLTNSWMASCAFTAQSCHFFGAATAVLFGAYFWHKKGAVIASIIFAAVAFVKEFWYDLNYELPHQTFGDSALDFTFYIVGIIVPLLLVLFVAKPKSAVYELLRAKICSVCNK